MITNLVRETKLYEPIKQFRQGQDYVVKGEIGAVDVAGCRGNEAPVLSELKTAFSLPTIHQAMERLTVSDLIYIAVPHKPGKVFGPSLNATEHISIQKHNIRF